MEAEKKSSEQTVSGDGTVIFQPTDKSHFKAMFKAEFLLWIYNKTPIWHTKKRRAIIKKLLHIETPIYEVTSPFHCQYGNNIHIGKNFFSNFNLTILDHTDVYIGDNVLIAPNVTICTVKHPLEASKRIVQYMDHTFHPDRIGDFEINQPVHIGNNVWLASGVTVCPGVTIGDNAVIGAGSVVTKDIPANVFACGVPCRVVKEIEDKE